MADNLLNQVFNPCKPDEVWVSDITCISTEEGWLYLARIKDVFTCEIAGHAMGARMTRELVSQALQKAVKWKKPAAGLILHSDRGSQYCSHGYHKLVEQFGLRASMSRRGNCYDNAPMESFWGSLKNELVRQTRFTSAEHLRSTLDNYCKVYNHHIPQKALGFISPVDALKQWYAKQPELFNKRIYKQTELDI